jgi:pimeloyl-ACP methyl ester carboxylesterase
MPDPKMFPYTFDKTSEIIESFLKKVGFTHFGLYLQDYGGPVGFRIVTRHPDWLEWLIIQNTNAYEVGFTAVWDSLRAAYWKRRTLETEKPLEAFLQADTVKLVYTHGHPRPELISPDNWNMDLHYLSAHHWVQLRQAGTLPFHRHQLTLISRADERDEAYSNPGAATSAPSLRPSMFPEMEPIGKVR